MLLDISDETRQRISSEFTKVLELTGQALVRYGVVDRSFQIQQIQNLYGATLLRDVRARQIVQATFAVHHACSFLNGPLKETLQVYAAFASAARALVDVESDPSRQSHVRALVSTGVMMTSTRATLSENYRAAQNEGIGAPFDLATLEAVTTHAEKLVKGMQRGFPSAILAGLLSAKKIGALGLFSHELYVTPIETEDGDGCVHFLRKPETWYGDGFPDRRKYLSLKEIAVVMGELEATQPDGMSSDRWKERQRHAEDRVLKRIARVEKQLEPVRTKSGPELVRRQASRRQRQ